MQLEKRALYNLLRLNSQVNPSMEVEPWQVADLRELSLEQLLSDLEMEQATFLAYAEECDTPEELAPLLSEDEGDEFYLLVFELWRRLLPEKQSLSIFGDHLDRLIERYDADEAVPELEDALNYLREIFEENVDEGAEPEEVARRFCLYLAHDLEDFFHDYICEQLDQGEIDYAADLLEGFGPFMLEARWRELLEIRLLASSDPERSEERLEMLLSDLEEDPELDLLLEVAHHAIQSGEDSLFKRLIRRITPLLEVESDLVVLLERCADYCDSTGVERGVEEIEQMLHGRDRDPAAPLQQVESLLRKLFTLIGFEPA